MKSRRQVIKDRHREWQKRESGLAASVGNGTHLCHRSIKSDTDISITVTRVYPDFKNLGSAKTFKEAIAMADADYQELANSENTKPLDQKGTSG